MRHYVASPIITFLSFDIPLNYISKKHTHTDA